MLLLETGYDLWQFHLIWSFPWGYKAADLKQSLTFTLTIMNLHSTVYIVFDNESTDKLISGNKYIGLFGWCKYLYLY